MNTFEFLPMTAAAGAAILASALLAGCDASGSPHEAAVSRGEDAPATEAVADFKAYALNALLVPLLDDDRPARWVEPTSAFDCNDGSVTLEGAHLSERAPVPEPPFTLHWHLVDCTPLGLAFDLTGDVDVTVHSRNRVDYVATVRPMRLRVTAPGKSSVLDEAFEARTPHGMAPSS